jgi:hypothetical protein
LGAAETVPTNTGALSQPRRTVGMTQMPRLPRVASVAIFCVLAVLALVILTFVTRISRADCPPDARIPTREYWRQQLSVPYRASFERVKRVRLNYDRVVVGSSKEEVLQAFGPPDFEYVLPSNGICIPCAYAFTYYFDKPQQEDNIYKDKVVTVFFKRGKLVWVAGNVGLPDKGSPKNSTVCRVGADR